MPHVITQNCCNDAACVPVCPVDCIHPTPDEPEYVTAEMLYIDPDVCIDCGACVDVCPVGAVSPDSDLTPEMAPYEQINADYYAATGSAMDRDTADAPAPPRWDMSAAPDAGPLKVAIVGTGAAGHYAAEALLEQTDVPVRIDMFERLCTPGGLVRSGVAPDHSMTKQVQESFDRITARKAVRAFFNVEVGSDISHSELLHRYHAVVYAVGAIEGKRVGLPGEELPNSVSASEFVAWLNGHPDFATRSFDLSHERAVILGNGNVALDVARILAADPGDLAGTDIAEHALDALRNSRIREVVIVARRGPQDAAFTAPELRGLIAMEGVDVVVDPEQLASRPLDEDDSPHRRFSRDLKLSLLRRAADTAPESDRRIVLKFFRSPEEILGEDRVSGIRLRHRKVADGTVEEETDTLDCGLVLRAVGYRGTQIPEVPFDEERGTLPNEGGRVLDSAGGVVTPGTYTTGWIKRGPTGGIGMNRKCAQETVQFLLADFVNGLLSTPTREIEDLAQQLPDSFDLAGAQAIDRHEIAEGNRIGRPRVKVVRRDELLTIALSASKE